MSGEVNKVSIAQLQARITELSKNNSPEARQEIQKCMSQIGDLLRGAGNVETTGGELSISQEMGFHQNNQVADETDIEAMGEFSRHGAGSKDEARQNVREEFGQGALDDDAYKAKKEELKTAEKKLKELEKQLKNIKFDSANPAEYNEQRREIQAQVAEQQRVVADLQKEMVDIETARYGDSKKFAKKFEKAATDNVEQYQKTLDVQHVFVDKSQAEAFKEEHPELKDNVKVVNNDDMEALTKLHQRGVDAIKEAEATGDPDKIAEAHAMYDDYVDIFGVDDEGNTDYTVINTRNVQNILVDKSGGDQNFNLDETQVLADDLQMSKGEIRHLAKTFGFGTEKGLKNKFIAAGTAAAAALAGNALSAIFGKTHSHQTAEATSTAHGETVQGEVDWIATNGETFSQYYEAQGGTAVASVVAEACAKIPLVGQLAGPILAGVTAFFLTKGKTEDLFNGANAEEALNQIQTADKEARPVLKMIRDMEITGDPEVDTAIKLAVIKASIGEDTKACNLRELSKAYVDLKDTVEKIKIIEGELKKPESEEVQEEAPDPVVEPDPVDYDVEKEPDIEVRTELPRLKLREGTWYTSHAYVNEDGTNLTEAERKMVQKALKEEANRIALVDTNGDGKADFKDKKVSLPTIIELPGGKKVKVADDAYERIMKLPAKGGGGSGTYGVHVAKIAGKWHVIDPKNNNKVIAGPFDTEAQAREAEKALEDEANKPKAE